ncbi:MAG: hypothetical protein JNK64_34640 [Myxococcales bacterium]|nr:hypothetical protein [Myxococcales bacterium]
MPDQPVPFAPHPQHVDLARVFVGRNAFTVDFGLESTQVGVARLALSPEFAAELIGLLAGALELRATGRHGATLAIAGALPAAPP